MQLEQPQEGNADHGVAQNRIHGRCINADAGKLRQTADARPRMRIANPRRRSRGASMAAALDQAAQPASALYPWPRYADGRQRNPQVDMQRERRQGSQQSAQHAAVKAHRPQQRRGTLHPLSPERRAHRRARKMLTASHERPGPSSESISQIPITTPAAAYPPWLMMRMGPICHSCQELAIRSATRRMAIQISRIRTTSA